MILYPGSLPQGVLLGDDLAAVTPPEPPVVAARPAPPPAPVWFDASREEGFTMNADNRVVGWLSPAGTGFVAVDYNKSGTERDAARGCLRFKAKEHAGLVAMGALPHGDCFSLGLIFTPPVKDDALTLLSLQCAGDDDYSFLSCDDDYLRFGVRNSDETLSLPAPQKATLAVLTSDGRQVKLAVNRGLAVSVSLALPAAALDLYIGCRGGARSLVNKVGNFDLTDVLIWPDKDVLEGEIARAPESALALWQQRLRDDG